MPVGCPALTDPAYLTESGATFGPLGPPVAPAVSYPSGLSFADLPVVAVGIAADCTAVGPTWDGPAVDGGGCTGWGAVAAADPETGAGPAFVVDP